MAFLFATDSQSCAKLTPLACTCDFVQLSLELMETFVACEPEFISGRSAHISWVAPIFYSVPAGHFGGIISCETRYKTRLAIVFIAEFFTTVATPVAHIHQGIGTDVELMSTLPAVEENEHVAAPHHLTWRQRVVRTPPEYFLLIIRS